MEKLIAFFLMHSEGTALEENSKLEISDKKIERSFAMRKQSLECVQW